MYVLDVIDTEAEADAEVEAERCDPERETDCYTDKCKGRRLTKEVEKMNVPCSYFSFESVLKFTLELPLRLGDGLFSSALDPCLDSDFELDLDFEPDLECPLVPLVDLLKLRLAVLAMSISTPPLKPNKRYQHLQPLLQPLVLQDEWEVGCMCL